MNLSLIQIVLALIGSNVVTVFVTKLLSRKKEGAETTKMDAQSLKLLAEAKKINVESDNTVAEGWKHVADALVKERDKAFERIDELQTMLQKEEEMSSIKLNKIKNDAAIMERELRDQLQIERERYDKRINEILQQILKFKLVD